MWNKLTRRELLARTGLGCGSMALGSLLTEQSTAAAEFDPRRPLQSRAGHFAGVRSVIWIVMNGGASQVDTWDYKPELQKRNGQMLAGPIHALAFSKRVASCWPLRFGSPNMAKVGRGHQRSFPTPASMSTTWHSFIPVTRIPITIARRCLR